MRSADLKLHPYYYYRFHYALLKLTKQLLEIHESSTQYKQITQSIFHYAAW